MKRSIRGCAITGLAMVLCAIGQPGPGLAVAMAAGMAEPGVFIQQDGRITVRGGADHDPAIMSTNDLPSGREECRGFGEAAAGAPEVTIGSNPRASYAVFMRVANWLEDCGVHHLRMTGHVGNGQGSAGRTVAIDLQMKLQIAIPPVVMCRPAPTPGAAAICPKPKAQKAQTYISLHQDGSLTVLGAAGGMPTTLAALAGDLPKEIESNHPTAEPVLVRADGDVTYAQFVQLLDQLDRDGYTRLGLINENF